jgi:hypothetical protein
MLRFHGSDVLAIDGTMQTRQMMEAVRRRATHAYMSLELEKARPGYGTVVYLVLGNWPFWSIGIVQIVIFS